MAKNETVAELVTEIKEALQRMQALLLRVSNLPTNRYKDNEATSLDD